MGYIDSRKTDPIPVTAVMVGDHIRFNGGHEHVVTERGLNDLGFVTVTIEDIDNSDEEFCLEFAPNVEVWKVVR